MDTLSESDGSLSLQVSSGYGTIVLTMQSLVVKGQHSFVQGTYVVLDSVLVLSIIHSNSASELN